MQVPAYVEYERATSVEHALTLLARFGPEARVLAGGHSLIPMMKLRLVQPETLIDINGLTNLSYVVVADGELRIGAMTRHAELLDSAAAGQHFAILHDAERVIADPIVRLWGTVGGSLCQADPSEDLSAAFAALKATMVIQNLAGTRTVLARDFHTGPYETVVAPGEMLTEIRIAIVPGGGSAYQKVGRRVGDWPVGAAGAAVWLDGDRIADAGIGLTAVGAQHFSAAGAEVLKSFTGSVPNKLLIADVGGDGKISPRMAEQAHRIERRNAQRAIEKQVREVAATFGLQLGAEATEQDDTPQHQADDQEDLPQPAKIKKFPALSAEERARGAH
jgi:carbon-monoxide dehydrogenase medium subunit